MRYVVGADALLGVLLIDLSEVESLIALVLARPCFVILDLAISHTLLGDWHNSLHVLTRLGSQRPLSVHFSLLSRALR